MKFCEEILGFALIPWQRWLLIHALELYTGGFRFRTILILVARQNGKTSLVEVKNLWKMFVLQVQLIIGTAQILDYAEESWDKAVEIVESVPELAAEVAHVDKTNGKKALKLNNGTRWKIAAASRRGGRSLSADDVNLDELREHHNWESWAAVTKTTMARPNAQVFAFSNAGDDRSIVLNNLQEKAREVAEQLIALLERMVVAEAEEIAAAAAREGVDTTLGLFEWSAPDDCPIDDPDMWALANPSLGYTVTEEAIRSALATDPEPIFRTEILCQRVPDLQPSKIPLTAWVKCADPKSAPTGGLVLSWEVSWDRAHGAIGVAGYRPDGIPHLELIDYRQGTDWMPARFGELVKKHNVVAVVYNPAGPGASLLTEITERLPVKLEPQQMTARDQANACGRLYDAAVTQQMRHLGDERLLEALRKSATRQLVDSWAWDMKHSAGEISPLGVVTNALHGLYVFGKVPTPAPPPMVERTPARSRTETSDLFNIGF
ncbi:hypothetical protein ACQP1P_38615 [Dactylosporangium sp. CA-052675]|uniref:hypothetical protein n=1 Tax=Dactylosporangium sp. CA-052675 TaxID=3239927 RepID=UPI003D8D4290